MIRHKSVIGALLCCVLALSLSHRVAAEGLDAESQATLDTVMSFMGAMGSGDQEKMSELMADDMVWHNEGDKSLPWLGPWKGKDEIFKFLGVIGENLQFTLWENEDVVAFGDTVAVFGKMNGVTIKSEQEIGEFTFALRAKVSDGKVVLWNWFEDSYALSQAYHNK